MPRTSAPDDDEDFLRDLNRRNRRKDQDPDRPSGETGTSPSPE